MVIDKSDYDSKMKEHLENPLHYQKLEHDPSADFVEVIKQWSKKWLEKGQINEEIASWVINGNAKPCLLYTSPSPRDGLLSRMPSSA